MKIEFIFFLIFINFILFFLYKSLSAQLNIYDYPDNKLKKHKLAVPIFGGIIIFLNFLILIIINFLTSENLFFYEKKREFLSFSMLAIIFFLIGIYDDKYKISFSIRIVLSLLLTSLVVIINENLLINNLLFSFYPQRIFIENYSFIFTITCILIFIHAVNMFDGINVQLISFFIILNIYLLIISTNLIYFYLLPCLALLLILNLKGKIFLGDSGAYILGAIYSFMLIYEYNISQNIIFADKIFVLCALPGLDLLRLSIVRLYNGRNIFSGDLNHIHHILIKKYGQIKTILIMIFLVTIPIFLTFKNIKPYLIILICITMYILALIISSKKK